MTALARKYRPQLLADLLGQDALRNVVSAAIETDRLAQSYILTGVRGVGKTTTARIIARSVNCESGPTVTPCGTCQSCIEIAADGSLDVIELDAASRNGVGDIRDLIETVSYAPMRHGARKIYILDEAHMLSTSAWNALLKTLEEPPAHVMFIFATTEPRKIPATIQSRCQKFSLRRIDAEVIRDHLSAIAEKEGVTLENGVAMTIAQAGEGSMRDALSILDQAMSGRAQEEVTLAEVREMIGRATPRAMIATLGAIIQGKTDVAVEYWRRIMNGGIDPMVALDDLMTLLHQACLAAVAPQAMSTTGLTKEDASKIQAIAKAVKYGYLSGAQKLLFEARPTVADNPHRAQAAEILILRLALGFQRK